MEAEKQKLVNLRDRASELGEMKELKRIVEQLKELERPETRAARLSAPLGIEADPKMDPAIPYDPEAEEREKKEKGGAQVGNSGAQYLATEIELYLWTVA